MPINKKDSSQLDWHYKLPSKEELQDPYKCFPEEMWPTYFQAAKESTTLPPRKRNDPNLMRDDVKRLACEDCTLFYQLLMQKHNRCHPVEGAITPEDRERLND